MISGANEQELEIANDRADLLLENQQLKDYKNKWEALKLAIIGNFNKTQNTIYLDILANIIEPIERADNNDK